MMYRSHSKFRRAVRSWLRSERVGEQRDAERHLRRAFRSLASPVPSADFVEATMLRLGVPYRARTVSQPGSVYKLLVSACLTAAGAALVMVPAALMPWVASLRPALLVQSWTSVLVALSQRLASGFAVWKVLTEIGETVAQALASPSALLALTVALAVSFATFRALSGLVSFERGTQNV